MVNDFDFERDISQEYKLMFTKEQIAAAEQVFQLWLELFEEARVVYASEAISARNEKVLIEVLDRSNAAQVRALGASFGGAD